ncbi:GSCOCG00005084001-RA-CDS [Cotesia congregata]|nr:GSCOCG00005084001-RA-CDS [Cotesia congregata]
MILAQALNMKTQEREYSIALGKETGIKVGRWKIETMGVSTATILLVLFFVRLPTPYFPPCSYSTLFATLAIQLWLFIIRLLATANPVDFRLRNHQRYVIVFSYISF